MKRSGKAPCCHALLYMAPVSQRMLEKYGRDITLCPKCNKGKLVWICTTYAKQDTIIFTKNRIRGKELSTTLNNKASPDEKTEAL